MSAKRMAGFTIFEALAAAAVVAVAIGMLVAILGSARRAQRARDEAMTAWSVAQGAFERLRGAPLVELPGAEAKPLALPAEAVGLRAAALSAECRPWKGEAGLRHLRVTFSWEPQSGKPRRLVCEGVIADARQR